MYGVLTGPAGQEAARPTVQEPARVVVWMIESGPIPAVRGVVRWWLIDLAQWIYGEFRITIADIFQNVSEQ
jgi:putative transposase